MCLTQENFETMYDVDYMPDCDCYSISFRNESIDVNLCIPPRYLNETINDLLCITNFDDFYNFCCEFEIPLL